ncbi:MAG: hypothetical protein KC535_00325 [Nanoarchaeota archaeon]|nr:hypothetical protein [Nanoarchaeota archaeon]
MAQQKTSGFDLVKNIGYILVIVLIFSPLTFLISNTITGTATNDCYTRVVKFNETDNSEQIACEQAYQEQRSSIEQQQFLIVSIISIVTIVLLLFLGSKIHNIISYSLFFAGSLNTIIIVMKNSSSSLLAASLGTILFVLVLFFINKHIKH